MSPGTAPAGGCGSAIWMRTASCSWTRPARPRTWSGAPAGVPRASAWSMQLRRGTGNHNLRGWSAGERDHRALRAGWPHDVLDGPMTGEAFRAYVEQVLAPELEPGDAVVMDNFSPHKVAGVQEAIRAAGGSVLYLPSYSP